MTNLSPVELEADAYSKSARVLGLRIELREAEEASRFAHSLAHIAHVRASQLGTTTLSQAQLDALAANQDKLLKYSKLLDKPGTNC